MKKDILITILVILSLFGLTLYVAKYAEAATPPATVPQGGTGWGVVGLGNILFGQGGSLPGSLRLGTSTGLTFSTTTGNLAFNFGSTTALSVTGLSNGECVQIGTGGLLTTTGSACVTSGSFPFTPQSYGNSTSTAIAFLGGLISNGSTTIPGLSGFVGANNGLLYGLATSTISLPYSQITGTPTSLPTSTLLSDSNTFSGALNTFSNTIKVSSLEGLIGGNSGTLYQIATSTNFVTSLTANAPLSVDAATGGVTISCSSCAAFAYPFPNQAGGGNATSSLTGFTGGILATASSTIGNGTATGGLTINGVATTTNLIPLTNGTYTLGNAQRGWGQLFMNSGNLITWAGHVSNPPYISGNVSTNKISFSNTTAVSAADQSTGQVGILSPMKRLVLPFATSTATWTATSTPGVDAATTMVMTFNGTIQYVHCKVNTFLGINIQKNGSSITPSYFIASSTVGTTTSATTFVQGDTINIYAGTTTTATASSGVVNGSCTLDITQDS